MTQCVPCQWTVVKTYGALSLKPSLGAVGQLAGVNIN